MNDSGYMAKYSKVMLVQVILLFLVTQTKSINISSAPYADLPKCCKVGSEFAEQSGGFFCNKSENERVVIQTDVDVDLSDAEEYECVEAVSSDLFVFRRTTNETSVVQNISDRMLSKCCPNNYFYDPVTHSCVENSKESSFNATFLQVGLPKCQIIYDYKFENMDEIKIEDSNVFVSIGGEKYPRGEYCVDETMNRIFVVRVCEQFDICDSVLCLHKCCPDGQSFVNGSHCKDTFVYGLDLYRFSNLLSDIYGKCDTVLPLIYFF